MMKKHRMGRVQTPWTNLEAPIRCSSYRDSLEQAKTQYIPIGLHKKRRSISIAAQSILPPKLASCASSLQQSEPASGLLSSTNSAFDEENLPPPNPFREKTEATENWRINHVRSLEKKERADALREWPALDMETQQSITKEYQALHEEVKARGLYKCRYSNYAIEAIRYSILFGCFLYFLFREWYLTSAVFLGLFWVRILTNSAVPC
jgi:delta8-fatty-acid desaturase